jgi:hypothetical protein
MTIDERLDRLTAGHEALTQTVGILAWTTHEPSPQITDIVEAAARRLHIAQFHQPRRTLPGRRRTVNHTSVSQ